MLLKKDDRGRDYSTRYLSDDRLMKKIAMGITDSYIPEEVKLADPERVATLTSIILKEAGVDIEKVAAVLGRCVSARKKVSLQETVFKADGSPELSGRGTSLNVWRVHEVEDLELQLKTAQVVLALLTPKTEGPAVGQMNIIIPQVPAEMLQLRGDAARKYYVDRTRALALGHEPPPIENYLEGETLDGLAEKIVQPDGDSEGPTPQGDG